MKKRILIVGPKPQHIQLIAQEIEQAKPPLRKVASIVFKEKTILVPSSYLESPWMHKHIISLQQKASKVLFLLPIPSQKKSYPPNYAHVFRVPVIGVGIYETKDKRLIESPASQQILREVGCQKESYFLELNNQKAWQEFVEEIS